MNTLQRVVFSYPELLTTALLHSFGILGTTLLIAYALKGNKKDNQAEKKG